MSDPPLHYQKVRIVDVQLNTTKEFMDLCGRRLPSIQPVLVSSTHDNLLAQVPVTSSIFDTISHLSRYGDDILIFKSSGTPLLVTIVEGNTDDRFGHSRLSFLVDQIQ